MTTKKKPIAKKTVAKKSAIVAKVAAKSKPLPMFLRPKPIEVVTRTVLEKIADNIYNPKTKTFLNLCDGTLQNGPDPVCQARPMHCGLGELYFVVTGHQPEEDGVSENDVIDLVTERSTLGEQFAQARTKIEKLGLNSELTGSLLQAIDNVESDGDYEYQFREALDAIPSQNDDGGGNPGSTNDEEDDEGNIITKTACYGVKDAAVYVARAKRVADQLRTAAKLLPR